jgi:hypothetical protein
MKTNRKLFYEAPAMDSVELKLEGVIANSDPLNTAGTNMSSYNASSIFGNEEYGEDW